ncbi:hypothetical protein QEH59_15590 [Coraliomargarita sp. SDUM461004]|uniref:Uncharacterized protein n=1 Tax=Thalassobacterium sedimentorum TaxID=3041258 RepID=A0ABU1AM46_9BACT|nr:hypothetical protein [Coraliomargarita sp. SDUM461004]MDQ8195856.1 hypothetical protein [Coraliomargarita sp. SDUM461004]
MPKVRLEYRHQLSLNDLHFISAALAGDSPREAEAIAYLLVDPATVDTILDQPALLDYVLASPDTLRISPRLYFYLLSRHSLKSSGLDSPELADYVSGVLEFFLEAGFHPHTSSRGIFYIVDWLKQIEISPEGKRYELYVMAGEHLLFLTGIFPQAIEERSQRRGAPALSFYESVGGGSYRSAAQHPFSHKSDTTALYQSLAEAFPAIRSALNDLSDRLITLD